MEFKLSDLLPQTALRSDIVQAVDDVQASVLSTENAINYNLAILTQQLYQARDAVNSNTDLKTGQQTSALPGEMKLVTVWNGQVPDGWEKVTGFDVITPAAILNCQLTNNKLISGDAYAENIFFENSIVTHTSSGHWVWNADTGFLSAQYLAKTLAYVVSTNSIEAGGSVYSFGQQYGGYYTVGTVSSFKFVIGSAATSAIASIPNGLLTSGATGIRCNPIICKKNDHEIFVIGGGETRGGAWNSNQPTNTLYSNTTWSTRVDIYNTTDHPTTSLRNTYSQLNSASIPNGIASFVNNVNDFGKSSAVFHNNKLIVIGRDLTNMKLCIFDFSNESAGWTQFYNSQFIGTLIKSNIENTVLLIKKDGIYSINLLNGELTLLQLFVNCVGETAYHGIARTGSLQNGLIALQIAGRSCTALMNQSGTFGDVGFKQFYIRKT